MEADDFASALFCAQGQSIKWCYCKIWVDDIYCLKYSWWRKNDFETLLMKYAIFKPHFSIERGNAGCLVPAGEGRETRAFSRR